MIAAFISAICSAVAILFGKVITGEKNMSGPVLMKLQMLFVAACMSVPAIFWGFLQPDFFTIKYILLFAALIAVGAAFNILYYTALDNKNVCEIEPIAMLVTPATVMLAMIMFPGERNTTLLVISVIATVALLLSRFEKGHLDFDKYSWMLIGFVLLSAIEAVLIKYLLGVMNAVSLYGIRAVFLAIVFFLIFRSIRINKVNKKESVQIFANSIITSVEHVAKFFAIGMVGIVNSSLILLLGPIIILIFSKIFLKEKISLKRGIGDAVILMCIVAIVLSM